VGAVEIHLPPPGPRAPPPPVAEIGRDGGNLPVALADRPRLLQKAGPLAGVKPGLALGALRQQLQAGSVELPVQRRHEVERGLGQNLLQPARYFGFDLDTAGGCH